MSIFNIVPGANLVSGSQVALKLHFDLESYCAASKNLRLAEQKRDDLKKMLDLAIKENLNVEQIKYAYYEADKHVHFLGDLQGAFRERYDREFKTGLISALFWDKIRKVLLEQCVPTSPLYKLLQAIYPGESIPLAFQALNISLIELIKNSLDAKLERYLDSDADCTQLVMDISVEIVREKVIVTITDNGGGMSDAREAKLQNSIENKEYKTVVSGSENKKKTKDRRFYFGGANLGIAILCNYVLDGELLDPYEGSKPIYPVKAGQTALSIRNCHSTGGVEVTISSPIQAFEPIQQQPKKVKTLFLPEKSLFQRKMKKVNELADFSQQTSFGVSMFASSQLLSKRVKPASMDVIQTTTHTHPSHLLRS